MARHADVVIGSAYGDEGKGLVADALAGERGGETLVVRHNGGAQAGHTVMTPDGRRHVFSHFGSGTLAGAPTYLSRFFVSNPVLFHPERQRLLQLGARPKVFVDARSPVTTPFDMFVNTALERGRGASRHGSCGVGFGETVGRTETGQFALAMADLGGPALRGKLQAIRDRWFPRRLAALGLSMTEDEREALLSDGLLQRFIEDAAGMLDAVSVVGEGIVLSAAHVVFEGAQGLLLDQDMGHFPYVTRSHTGLRNVGIIAAGAGIARLDVHYVLRPYLTRHGAGPLPGELPQPPYSGIVDATNLPNAWQGALRFGLLNLDLLRRSVQRDAQHAGLPSWVRVNRRAAVTCLDQAGGRVQFIENEEAQSATPEEFVSRCLRIVEADEALTSYGPTRATCRPVKASAEKRGLRGLGHIHPTTRQYHSVGGT